MSEVPTAEEKAAQARRGPGAAARRGPMQMGTPGEKSQDFLPSAGRLLGRLRPERGRVLTAIALAVVLAIVDGRRHFRGLWIVALPLAFITVVTTVA